ncbi:hypothetical protein CIB48_g6873 [Xylaria polymorpha]|nr:hypothetical protein CIB48_g6873 [Xylaria polymorpha]
MRATSRLLATAASTGNGLRPAPLAILPPIPLYRRLLRAHRKHLPQEMRLLGDEYIKSEFRAHKKCRQPCTPNQQIGQMYELMQAIKKSHEEGDDQA